MRSFKPETWVWIQPSEMAHKVIRGFWILLAGSEILKSLNTVEASNVRTVFRVTGIGFFRNTLKISETI